MGLKPLAKLDASEEEISPSPDVDQQETDNDEREIQDSPELIVRGRFAFTGEGEDEVCLWDGADS